jgi:dihydrofolate synthase/folylpolyglutamate synthase
VKLIKVGEEVSRRSLKYDFEHQEIEVTGRLGVYRVSIPLLGQYQLDNTAAVIAALEVLIEKGYQISKESIIQGLGKVHFPGRMNIVSRQPLIVVDGGHNPGAAHNLREALTQYFKPAQSILVFGASSDKDIPGVIQELARSSISSLLLEPTARALPNRNSWKLNLPDREKRCKRQRP